MNVNRIRDIKNQSNKVTKDSLASLFNSIPTLQEMRIEPDTVILADTGLPFFFGMQLLAINQVNFSKPITLLGGDILNFESDETRSMFVEMNLTRDEFLDIFTILRELGTTMLFHHRTVRRGDFLE